MRINARSRFARLLAERMKALKVADGAAFEYEGEVVAHDHTQSKYNATGHGNAVARAFIEASGAAPELHDMALLNDGLACAIDMIRIVSKAMRRDVGTPLEGSIAGDVVVAFAVGAMVELARAGVGKDVTERQEELLMQYMRIGAMWQKQAIAEFSKDETGGAYATGGFAEIGRHGGVILSGAAGEELSFEQAASIATALRDAVQGRSRGEA